MLPGQFVQKWRGHSLTERSAAQQHFLDLCELVGHPKPADVDKVGDRFTFEKGVEKRGGGDGWADVWMKGFFGWEYKGPHKDLEAAYGQLLKYREALENPPLLVVSDTDRIEIHSNFTNTAHKVYTIELEELGTAQSLQWLRALFFDPEQLKPGKTIESITRDAAQRIGELAQRLRERGEEPHRVARFLDRMVFCLFAEDVELLPGKVFTRLVTDNRQDPKRFNNRINQLFAAMAVGGDFGAERIRYFNGNLFMEAVALELTTEDLEGLYEAALLDWGAVDPSIFGTLFERGLDPDKRSQLGAHYTSREDIETLVEPVVMAPLRREWEETKARVQKRLQELEVAIEKAGRWNERDVKRLGTAAQKDVQAMLGEFTERLAHVKVLDPACGSGNFLYVALQKLLDLEKEVIVWGMEHRAPARLPFVSPLQLHGIEINPYAFELAQMTVWIGYLQWGRQNGFAEPSSPVLKPMYTFEHKDAVLDLTDSEHPREPVWPAVDFIIGNPPFLGDKKMRRALGDRYVEALRDLHKAAVPGQSDLCCYWFEKARSAIESGQAARAGLLATQSIRKGRNRAVLDRIKATGDIFFAWSDREWILEGATVHVALVGFDSGAESIKTLDGQPVGEILANLTSRSGGGSGRRSGEVQPQELESNRGRAFIGTMKKAPLDIDEELALSFLCLPNPHGRPNSDVVRPWMNGAHLTKRPKPRWILDFPMTLREADAALYEGPFEWARRNVEPGRRNSRETVQRKFWWRLARPCPDLRRALRGHRRAIVTPAVAKHRLFGLLDVAVVPDQQLIVVAEESAEMLGVLSSRLHVTWVRRHGNQLRDAASGKRYNVERCFLAYPFPELSAENGAAIAAAATELDKLRTVWLNPPEWTRTEVLEFPAAVDGPWSAYVVDPDSRGIGTARYQRVVAKDEDSIPALKTRTLTALYNQRPAWLDNAHRALDEAVFAAYGWDPAISDDELLARLLDMNLQQAAAHDEPGAHHDE